MRTDDWGDDQIARHFGKDVKAAVAEHAAVLGRSDPSTTLRVCGHLVAGEPRSAVTSIKNAVRAAEAKRAAGKK